MGSAVMNITIEQGSRFSRSLSSVDSNGVKLNFATYVDARMQIRPHAASSTVYLELSKANGGIVLGTETLEIVISSAKTAALQFAGGEYDLELTRAGGDVERFVSGEVTLSKEVTR